MTSTVVNGSDRLTGGDSCGGMDTGPNGDGIGGGYLWCDGDNRADDPAGAPRPPVLYT